MTNLDKRVSKLEEEVDKIAIIPPDELMAFFKGEKDFSKDRDGFFLLFNEWNKKVTAAFERKSITGEYFFSVIPYPFREFLLKKMRKIKESKN